MVEEDRGLRRLEAELGAGLHLRSGDDELRAAAGADFQQGADEQRVGRVAQWRGEPPLPGCELGADGRIRVREFDPGDGGGAQARNQLLGSRLGGGRTDRRNSSNAMNAKSAKARPTSHFVWEEFTRGKGRVECSGLRG